MVFNFLASRTTVGLLLVGIIFVNLLFVVHNEESTSIRNSKEGLDQVIDHFMSDEYLATLKDEILETKKSELLVEVKADLEKKYSNQLYNEIKQSAQEKYRETIEPKVRNAVEKDVTEKYFELGSINYELLSEMKSKYYAENKALIKDLIALESLDSVLAKEKGKDELKQKVAGEIDALASRKTWFKFVMKDLLQSFAPKMPPITQQERGELIQGCRFATHTTIYDKNMLSRVKFSDERKADFSSNHKALVKKLLLMSTPPPNVYNGAGIVISGGGAYMAGALTTIVQVRETGSKLPIELVLNSKTEYDSYICDTLGSKFNYTCLVIEEEIGKDIVEEMKITKFQLKILGLLVTSFDHVIALDADNMPLKNPDHLLTCKAYLDTEFLLWPDLWQRTISPTYYEIAGMKAGEPVKRHGLENGKDFAEYFKKGRDHVHFHDLDGLPNHISTETGQMVFSKRKHYRSFLLALYYNMYGESHYWSMFYQGSPGDGDRDTFVPALHVFKEPYHVVERATWLAGFRREDNFFQETTIVQYDPNTSMTYDQSWKEWLMIKGYDSRMHFNQDNQYTRDLVKEFHASTHAVPEPEVFFLHVHRPKVNPILATHSDGYFDWNRQRNLGKVGVYAKDFGNIDWDLRFYTIAEWVACKGIKSDEWWKSVDRVQLSVCEAMSAYVNFLKKDTQDEEAQVYKNVVLE